jgi:hypothetical protein
MDIIKTRIKLIIDRIYRQKELVIRINIIIIVLIAMKKSIIILSRIQLRKENQKE